MNYRRFKLTRAAARVKRTHIMHASHQQSVGEHTFNVLCLMYEVIGNRIPSERLIKAILYHDVHEAKRGDPPAPTLWANEELRQGYKKLDTAIETEFEVGVTGLTPWEMEVLRFCDVTEFVVYGLEEVASGNVIFMPRVRACLKKIAERMLYNVSPEAEHLFLELSKRADGYPKDLGEEETHGWPS